VCHALLQDLAFFHLLTSIDQELAATTRLQGCPACGGPLHVADYPRKPRGCPAALQEAYSRRLSFTCGRCDHRTTPSSVRFAGRRVYLAVVFMLLSPPGSASARTVCDRLRIAAVTLKRWRAWWCATLPATTFWQSACQRFMPPVAIHQLPQSLLQRFEASALSDRLVPALRFIAPLSTRAMVR